MLERPARQYFNWVVALLLLACAYLHAHAINSLYAISLVGEAEQLSAAPPLLDDSHTLPPTEQVSARSIIDRNPFDSKTGPLGGEPIEFDEPEEPVVTDPLLADKCEGVRVESTAVATDPHWSSAVVQAPGDSRGKLCRVGDRVGDGKVAYIGYNRLKASPTVWLVENNELCQAHVFDAEVKQAKKKRRRSKKKARAKKKRKKEKKQRRPPKLPKEIASKIRQVNSTEFVVDRRAVDLIMEQQAVLMKSVRLRPNQKDGRVASLSVTRVYPDSLLGQLGIRNGDQIRAINGFSLTTPEKALEVYSRMRTADELNLTLTRKGKPVTITYRIR